VFGNTAPLYMAGLAFTAYGIHWFAMAHRRYIGSSSAPDAWMAIAFLFLSALGVDVFLHAGDIPVTLIFIGLTLIYLVEIPRRFLSSHAGGRAPRRAAAAGDEHLANVLHVYHGDPSCPWQPGLKAES
jgi:hypothetical protein